MNGRQVAPLVLLAALLLLAPVARAAPSASSPPGLPPDSTEVRRLTDLGRVWGTALFFHPHLAYRTDIDWNAALVEAIPRVRAAQDSDAYARAVQSMLDRLDDPATRVTGAGEAAGSTEPPSSRSFLSWTGDSLLVATLNTATLDDRAAVQQSFGQLAQALPRATGIVFDLRVAPGTSAEQRRLYDQVAGQLGRSSLPALLSEEPLTLPGARSRMHAGFAPERGSSSGGYYSGFTTRNATRTTPRDRATDAPVVFLVNGDAHVPSFAWALQSAGRGAVLTAAGAPAKPTRETHAMTLAGGVDVTLRLSEPVGPRGGLLPDAEAVAGSGEAALEAAFERARALRSATRPEAQAPRAADALPPGVSGAPPSFSDAPLPAVEERLLAVFRAWAVIEHFFPYRDLMSQPWGEAVLAEYVPRVIEAEDAEAYHLALAEMLARTGDSHVGVYSNTLRRYFGTAPSPLRVRWIEEQPVVTGFHDRAAARTAGVERGDVILRVDGEDASARLARYRRYQAASTPWHGWRQATQRFLHGPDSSTARVTLRGADGATKDVRLPRRRAFAQSGPLRAGTDTLRFVADGIGYADLDRLESADLPRLFRQFADAEAIIFDMRGYPNAVFPYLGAYLADDPDATAAQIHQPLRLGPGPQGRQQQRFEQPVVLAPRTGDAPRYDGETVMLIDERAISQAEHTGLFLEVANGTAFVGSPTAGANGDVTDFALPGGLSVSFTGQAIRHADGRRLQRAGLQPDVEARPTIEGIRDGEDEVLQRAIRYVQSR